MKEDIRGGLSQVFWNREEGRLRTPLRFLVSLTLVFLFMLLLGIVAFGIGLAVGDLGPRLAALAELLSVLALTVAVLGVVWIVDRRKFSDIGLGFGSVWWRDFGAGLGIGTVMAALVAGVFLAAGGSIEGTVLTQDGDLFAGLSVGSALLFAVVFFLAIAVLEEVIFRGYLLVNIAEGIRTALGKRRAVLVALVGSGALFGIAHAGSPGATAVSILNISLFGLLLGGVYVLTNSLAIPIGLHTTWNFVLGPVFGLPVSGLTSAVAIVAVDPAGSGLVTGGAFGPEGGLIALLALAVGAVFLGLWIRRTTGEFSINEQIAVPDLWRRS